MTGARVGLPGQLATKATPGAERHALGLRAGPVAGRDLPHRHRRDARGGVRAAEENAAPPRRRAARCRPDSFVISGMQGLKKLVVRGVARNGEVRGITILYDQAMEGTMDPLVAPMSSAFVPFATGFAVAGAADAARRKVEYGTGVFVSAVGPRPDRPATDRRLQRHRAAGPRQRRTRRQTPGGELALLRVYGARNLAPIGMLGAAPRRRERHAGRHRRSAGARRRRGDLGGRRQGRRRGGDEPARNRAGAGIRRRRRARRPRPLRRHGGDEGAGGRRPGRPRRGRPWCRPSGSGISSRPITSRRSSGAAGVEAAKASVTRVICVQEVSRARRGQGCAHHLFLNFAGRFSTNAAMPSFWSSVANSAWNTRRSNSTPSASDVSNARLTASLADKHRRQRHRRDGFGDLHRLVHQARQPAPRARPGRRARPRRRPSCGRSGSGPWPWPCRPRGSAAACRR